MNKIFKWVGIGVVVLLALVIIVPITFWKFVTYSQTHEWHQKLTVQIETPAGLVTGSSVSDVIFTHNPNSIGYGATGGNPYKMRGEAVVVELMPGKYLFALLKGVNFAGNTDIIVRQLYEGKGRKTFAGKPALTFYRNMKAGDGKPLSEKAYPLLVTFSDINDPASVKKVSHNNLAASFGAGYSLKSITLEITDEKVTKGVVEGVLGWWRKYFENGYTMNGEKRIAYGVNDPLADRMTVGVFKTRGSK